jgi:hypothetical protein
LQSFFTCKNSNDQNEQNYLVVSSTTNNESNFQTVASPFEHQETRLFGGNKVIHLNLYVTMKSLEDSQIIAYRTLKKSTRRIA